MEGQLPPTDVPFVEGDFNARGWAGGDDESIYWLDKSTIEKVRAKQGMLAFVWSDDEPGTIIGVVATLDHAASGPFLGWRAKPVPGTFYRGPKPPQLLGGAGV